MRKCLLCLVPFLLTSCHAENEAETQHHSIARDTSLEELTDFSVDGLEFSVHSEWQEGQTNTPFTILFLFIPNKNDGLDGIIKVDSGIPTLSGLEANAEEMERRFNGKSEPILDGAGILTRTESNTVDIPSYIITLLSNDKVYFIFVAANNPTTATEACHSILETLEIPRIE